MKEGDIVMLHTFGEPLLGDSMNFAEGLSQDEIYVVESRRGNYNYDLRANPVIRLENEPFYHDEKNFTKIGRL